MANGRIGLLLAIGLAITLPLERLTVRFNLAPVDAFLVLLVLFAWPGFWRKRIRLHFPLAIPAWLIIWGGLVGTIPLLDIPASFTALFQELYIFVVFITFVNAFIQKRSFLIFQKIWFLTAAVESILLIMGRFQIGPDVLRFAKGNDLSETGRAVGTFENANSAGSYLVVSLFLLLALPFPRNRWVRAALIALLMLGIFATGGNSAMFGMLLGLTITLLYWLYHKGRTFVLAVGFSSILAMAAAGIFILYSLQSPLLTVGRSNLLFAFSRPDEKLEKRLGIWISGLNAYEQYPSGIGPNVTKTVVGGGMHNDFLAFLAERGPIGFAGLILVIGEALFWLLWLSRRPVGNYHQAIGALLGGLAAVWGAMATTHEISHERQVWLFMAAVYLYYKFERAEIERTETAQAEWGQAGYQAG
jgi:hypothetical protein